MKTNRILFIAAAALAMAACNKNGGNEITTDREELQLSGTIHNAEVQDANMTRGVFANGKTFDVFVEDASTPGYFSGFKTSTGEVIGTIESSKNTVDLTPKLYWDDMGGVNAELMIYGVYPSGTTITDTSIAWNISSDVNDSDLMRAKLDDEYTYGDKGTAAHLQFEHVLSKISIVLKSDETNGYSQSILSSAVVEYKIPASVTYDFKSNVMTAGTVGQYNFTAGTGKDNDQDNVYTILSYPLELGEDKPYELAKVTVAGNEYKVVITADESMQAGNYYVYNVTIKKSGISVESSVKDWEEGGTTAVDSKFIKVGDIKITDAINTKITENTLLYLYVNDGQNTGTTTYEYTSDDKWVLADEKKHLYWDDFGKTIYINALLVLDGEENGENILTSAVKKIEAVTPTITLNPFLRPFSKITVNVTSEATEETAKIDLDKLKYIEFTQSYKYVIDYDNVTVPTITTPGGLVKENFVIPTDSGDFHSAVAYIFPLGSVSVGYILCKIAVQETVAILNDYPLTIKSTTIFEAGKHYTYTVNITKSGISTTSAVTDWITVKNEDIESKLD